MKHYPDIDLSITDLAIINNLLATYLPHTEIWAYGSRVSGTAKPYSDLDLIAFSHSDQISQIYKLKEQFEESDLPFRVDLFVWSDLPKEFQKEIEENHQVLQKHR